VHLPWAVAQGIIRGVAALPGVDAPTKGTSERALLEASGRLEEFANLVGAKFLVTGTVVSQRGGATLAVHIIEHGGEAPRWEREFIYPQTSLISIEDQVVAAVAEILGTGKQPALRRIADASAYDDVARGDYFLGQHEVWAGDSARAAYERALVREPRSGIIVGRLARAYASSLERRGRAGPLGQMAALREGSALADRALALDRSNADAWTARAVFARVRDPGSYSGAVAAHERAIKAEPRNADAHHEYAITLLRLGRDAAAEAQVRQALSLERDRPGSLRLLAELEYLGRRYNSACALVNASIAADSYDPLAYSLRARVRVRLDEFRDAFSDAETARRLSGAAWGETLEFFVSAFAHEVEAAREDSRRLSSSKLKAGATLGVRDAVYLGMALTAVGKRDKAFDALSRARPRGVELRSALRDPGFDPLRSDPRFGRIGRDDVAPGTTSRGPSARAIGPR
jgi:tetratricopeptide (TPR) repeat protein